MKNIWKTLFAFISINTIFVATCLAADSGVEDAKYVSDTIKKHIKTIKYDALNPSPVSSTLYRLVFGELLLNPKERSKVNLKDLAILEKLPSHKDKQFLSKNIAETKNVCDIKKFKPNDIAFQALEFDDARQKSEDRLLKHYEKVLDKVSEETRALILENLDISRSRYEFVQSRVDMFSLAEEFPDVALSVLEKGCDRANTNQSVINLKSISLLEELTDKNSIKAFNKIMVDNNK